MVQLERYMESQAAFIGAIPVPYRARTISSLSEWGFGG